MNAELENEIRRICPEDRYETGFASLEGKLEPDWSKYKYGLSIVRRLDMEVIDGIKDGPTFEYHKLYDDVNDELKAKAQEIARIFEAKGIEAMPVKATLDSEDLGEGYKKALRYSFSHKLVATQAGLGWIGKTDLLVTHSYGPRVRLASVLTTEKVFETGEPINESQCGSCSLCVKKCPAQAASGLLWESSIDRDEFYSAYKCREYAMNTSEARLGEMISLCGICVSVCPRGKRKK